MKLKNCFLLAAMLLCTCLGAEDKILKANGFGVKDSSTSALERMDPKSEDLIRPTSVAVNCTEDGIAFELLFMMEDGSPIASRPGVLELFFQPDTLTGRQEYYQFYGRICNVSPFPPSLRPVLDNLGVPWAANMEILPYYYTHTTPAFPYLRDYSVEVGFSVNSATVRIFIPWSDLAATRPFDENGKGGLWRFGVMRGVGDVVFSWQGVQHRPATWGLLKLPDVAPSMAKKIYRKAALAVCGKPWLEAFRFDRKSLAQGRASLAADLQKRSTEIPPDADALSVEQWIDLIRDLRTMASGRTFVAAQPPDLNKKLWPDPVWKMESNDTETILSCTLDRPVRNGWLVNFSAQGAGKTKLPVTVSLDNTVMPENTRNWHFGAANKGSVLKLTIPNGKNKKTPWFRFRFTVEDFGRDLVPYPPMELLSSAPLESMPVLSPDGTVYAPHLSRHVPQCICQLATNPSVVWFGESMMDGLGFTEAYRKFSESVPSVECGLVGDNPRKVLWRLENSVFPLVKPGYIVLSFDPRPTIDEDAITIEKIIDMIHAQTPDTKILILSEIPTRRDLKYSDDLNFAKMNVRLKKMTEKRPYLRYVDVTAGFYDTDGNLQMDHYIHVYVAAFVYQNWCDAVERVLAEDLKAK